MGWFADDKKEEADVGSRCCDPAWWGGLPTTKRRTPTPVLFAVILRGGVVCQRQKGGHRMSVLVFMLLL